MKAAFVVLLLALGTLTGRAASIWQPQPGHPQIALWPNTPPDAQPNRKAEAINPVTDDPVAGKPWNEIVNVSQPTMTFYSPKTGNTGAAVVVFPGGGYKVLAIDLEGTEVCDWLTSRGISCIVLKYRVPDSGPRARRRPAGAWPCATSCARMAYRSAQSRRAGLLSGRPSGSSDEYAFREASLSARRRRRQRKLPARFRGRPLSRPFVDAGRKKVRAQSGYSRHGKNAAHFPAPGRK